MQPSVALFPVLLISLFGTLTVRAACPNAWDSFQTFCYLFVKEDGPWQDAEQQCQAQGGHLASSHSAFENHFILGKAFEHFGGAARLWLGGDNFQTSTELYSWTDGTPFDYEFWTAHEPPKTGQFCISMLYSAGKAPGEWVAFKCSNRLHFVCKKAAS